MGSIALLSELSFSGEKKGRKTMHLIIWFHKSEKLGGVSLWRVATTGDVH